jgi:MoaA/NifB/PqqE/SkfB family radical SAM enzyme
MKKMGLVRNYVAGRPVWCSWQVTRRCGSLCLFCEHRADGGDGELDLEGCGRVATQLGRLGSLVVSLTGGEPFLRPDLPQIVAMLAGTHFPILTTHGWLVTREKAREVWAAGLAGATVLFHDAEPQRHDEVAGVPGAHARAQAALEALTVERPAGRPPVNVKTRLQGADGGKKVEALARMATERGATLTVEPAYPVAQGQAGSLAGELLALKRRHRSLRSSASYLAEMDRALDEGVGGCRAGRAFLNVDHRGRVTKCVEFQRPEDRAGDLSEDGADAAALLPRLRRMQEANTCRACWYAFRGEVEGVYGLRGLARALPLLVRA